MTRQLEELAYRAWPAASDVEVDGWRMRMMNGVTRRANSVWPANHDGAHSIDHGVHEVERRYRSVGLPPRFQVSPFATPPGLEATLAARGYTIETPVAIQTLDATRLSIPADRVVRAEATRHATDAWTQSCVRGGRFAETQSEFRGVLSRIGDRARHATAWIEDQPIGSALGVLEDGWLGIFAMRTEPAFRRRGAGEALVRALARCGREEGSSHLYLQAERDNEGAMALYARCGFVEQYGYHYRRLPA